MIVFPTAFLHGRKSALETLRSKFCLSTASLYLLSVSPMNMDIICLLLYLLEWSNPMVDLISRVYEDDDAA